MTTDNHNMPEYSVSEISGALKRVVEDTFGYVRVRGEISGFKRAASGHVYLDLKDDKSVLNGVCWKGNASKLTFKPEDGLEVICTGKMTTYPGRSNYQLVIDRMEPAGIGALMALLEQRKKALAAEGLFDPARKQALPFMPQVIGVVTSPTGAVIRDILHRIEERFPVHVLVWPVRVQGEGAAEEIAAAITGFNRMPQKPDLLIVARGGGSIEDLWCFNEEIVVRAVAASTIPLISAVGHETDTTLIDFVSDKRAPTPTAAAEIAVPVRNEWLLAIRERGEQLNQSMIRRLDRHKERIEGLARGIPQPSQLLSYATQRLDDWGERLTAALPVFLERKQQKLQLLVTQHKPQPLLQHIARENDRVMQLDRRLQPLIQRAIRDKNEALTLQSKLFDSLNYRNVLARGYALVRGENGKPVTSAGALQQCATFTVMLHDGDVTAQPAEAPKRRRPSVPQTPPVEQKELF